MSTPVPSFCRLEYWNASAQEWVVGHAGIALLYPRRYIERLEVKGKIGRVTIIDTGEVIQPDTPLPAAPPECAYCDTPHPLPHDGTCLL